MDRDLLERLSVITAEEQEILDGRTYIDRSLYMTGSRNIISCDRLLRPGQFVGLRPHTRFIEFPEHTHDFIEMVYMCSGKTTHIINDREFVLSEGDLMLLGRNTRQSVQPARREDIAVNIIIRPSFMASTLPFIGEDYTPLRQFIVDCLAGKKSDSLFFRVGDILPIRNQIESLIYILTDEKPYSRNIIRLLIGLIFAELLDYTERLTTDTAGQNAMVSVLRYIEAHYRDGTLEEIAAKLGYEPASLSRIIINTLGESFTGLIQEKRLSQAAWLLKNTDCRIEEVASAVGYENKSYFYRLFAARYGKSPKKYRDTV
ncbi:MAG: helix-turn-helix domain-containing protein [Lachnospiraceae bacterium]|nr:helix-turn-helix domain-containing protein [Lachnospiraceae bacterium]